MFRPRILRRKDSARANAHAMCSESNATRDFATICDEEFNHDSSLASVFPEKLANPPVLLY